ncbi:accessory gene regulator B family protein [Clostridium sp. BL-8]|uniref:accessory gene regulator B family protein n=1 Tax=Clostridium sp. BL-8 TaxID=349938 RepID=UPI00098CEC60|nr:accessory gene regulator B family protein [Clostridium sp. BL-8]OOM74022.1 putative AgrB-like protein [Clostridium sp. BL-8]
MIKSLSIKISQHLGERNSSLTKKDILKIQYVLEVIFGDLSKLLIIFLIFLKFHELKLFFLIYIILLTTRSFLGGLHCKTFNSCLIWSTLYFVTVLLFSNLVPYLKNNFYISSFVLFFIIALVYAPCPNEKRPMQNDKILKTLSLISISFWGILFFKSNNIQICNCIFISLFVQISQVIFINLKGVVFNGKIYKHFFSHIT